MKISFRRITSSGSFIPEIDGLRFIAIASVILYHLNTFIKVKDHHHYIDAYGYAFLNKLLSHGSLGVPLFFVISGFVLGLPFAKFYIGKEGSVNLKKYFLRRLTRLEPPYIIVMTVLLFGAVYFSKTISWENGVASYFSSIIYCHNFIYPGVLPLLNVVTWSLEVEVQFYIFAPVIAYLFFTKSSSARRLFLLGTVVFFLFINYFAALPFISLINYIQYFLAGFLLVDLYVSKSSIFPKTKFDYLIGLLFFSIIWMFDKGDFKFSSQKILWELAQLASIFFLYYYVIFHKVFKILSFKLVTNIGGMCYSIYLLHYPVISMFGNPLLKFSFSKYSFLNISIYFILLVIVIIVISSVFFLFIERPCMDKNWYKKLIKKRIKVDFAKSTTYD